VQGNQIVELGKQGMQPATSQLPDTGRVPPVPGMMQLGAQQEQNGNQDLVSAPQNTELGPMTSSGSHLGNFASLLAVDGVRIQRRTSARLEAIPAKDAFTVYGLNWPAMSKTDVPSALNPLFEANGQWILSSSHKHKKKSGDPVDLLIANAVDKTPAFSISRPFKFSRTLHVFDAQGDLIGKVRKHAGVVHTRLQLLDASKQELWWLKGPKKQWTNAHVYRGDEHLGFFRNSSDDTFQSHDICFPKGADTNSRILMITAAIFLDMFYF
jgi:hypothetical protein